MMKDKMLGIITTILLLVGCDSSDSGGLSFDVSGHWELSLRLVDFDENFESIANVVVDPEGRFMFTDGDFTAVGRNADSIKLNGSGVSLSSVGCFPDDGSTTGFICDPESLDFEIVDANTLLASIEDTLLGVIEYRLQRLPQLDKAVAFSELAGSWQSTAGTGSALVVNVDGSYRLVRFDGGEVEGNSAIAANNIFTIDGATTFGGEPVEVSGLGFVDAEGLLNIGVSAVVNGEIIATGDIFSFIEG